MRVGLMVEGTAAGLSEISVRIYGLGSCLRVETPAGQNHRNQGLGFTGWLKRTIGEALGLGRRSEVLG